MLSVESITVLVGGIATLAIFSFIFFKENKVYRIFEHLYIGIASGFLSVYTVKALLWADILVPLLGLDIVVYPDGTLSKPYNYWLLCYLLPLALGLLYYCAYLRRLQWLSKLAIGVALGASGGLAFKGFFNEVWPQITSSFRPLIVFESGVFSPWASLENTLFVFILLAVMSYFIFTLRYENSSLKRVATSGRWLMMLSFGAFFGSTVMARMSLLIERLTFLISEWWPLVHAFIGLKIFR